MRRRWWTILVPVAILLGIAIPNILSGNNRGRGYSDQVNYHQRVIETFIQQWPSPDISNYAGVMTPMYHLMQAGIAHWFGADTRTLQLLGAIFGPLAAVILWLGVSRLSGPLLAILLALPLAASPYIVDSTIWLLPDNMSWALVAGILVTCFGFPADAGRYRRMAAAGAMLLVLIATRQSNIWLAAVVWACAWVDDDPPEQSLGRTLADWRRRSPRALTSVLATLPAFALLGYFFWLWGGRLQPPMWDEWYARKWNPSGVPFVLALVGLFSAFYAGFLLPAVWQLLRRRMGLLFAAAIVGAIVCAIPRTDYDMSQGRYGAIWSIADKFPAPAGRSLLMIALGAAGSAALVCWGSALDFRRRWVFLGAIAAFTATQVRNPWLYQRYAEPLLLMLFGLAAAAIWHGRMSAGMSGKTDPAATTDDRDALGRLAGGLRYVGPAALSVLLAAMVIQSLRGGAEVKIMPPGEIGHPPSKQR
ncbi:MAG: hypothetical protein IT435_19995 [Phycisphaerales bacterium]|nr:hypothetical protein [Phycisphaerales bacterium]